MSDEDKDNAGLLKLIIYHAWGKLLRVEHLISKYEPMIRGFTSKIFQAWTVNLNWHY